ncbi:MAG: hypothetical protein WCI50_02740 [Actinomycetes bacterium]
MTDADSSTTSRSTGAPPAKRHLFRALIASILVVLAALLVPLSVVGVWLHHDIMSTQGYVNTVTPLADQKAVTDAVAHTAVDALFQRAQVEQRIADILPGPLDALGSTFSASLRTLADEQVSDLLATPEFHSIWVEANRLAHAQVVKLFTGEGKVVKQDAGKVVVDLSGVVDALRKRLVKKGVTLLKFVSIPEGGPKLTIIQSDTVATLQPVLRALDRVSVALPFVALALAVAAVAVSVRRRRTLVVVAVAIALTDLAFIAACNVVRRQYLDAAANQSFNQGAARSVFDVLTRALLDYAWAVVIAGAVVAVAAFVSDPRRLAALTRLVRGDALARRTGLAALVERYQVALRVVAAVVAALVLAVWPTPTLAVLVVVVVVLVVVLGIVGALARLARSTSTPSDADDSAPSTVVEQSTAP